MPGGLSARRKKLFLIFVLTWVFFVAGCSMTPVMPMEDRGPAQFRGDIDDVTRFLLIPSRATQAECRASFAACQAFIESFRRQVLASSGERVVTQSLTGLNDTDIERVNAHARDVGASHVIVWTVGIFDEVKAWSFSPHTFGISMMDVRPIAANSATFQLIKPYNMLGLNNSPFVELASATGRRLGAYFSGAYLANSVN